jgi:integrase
MKGCIARKNKVYYAVLSIHGKRKWFRAGATKKDAQRTLNEKLHEVEQPGYRELTKATFKDFSEKWLEVYAKHSVKRSTLAGYTDIINRLLVPAFGHYDMQAITTGQLQAYVAGRKNTISARTVCNEIVIFKEMFKHALRWGYLKHNPAEYVERPKVEKTEIEVLSPQEVEMLLEKAHPHYKVAFMTAFLTGVRSGELWGLQWGDVDWNSKQIHVRRSLWKGHFQTPKSKCSVRKIDIPEMLLHELRRWKLQCPVSEHDLVFPSPSGKPSHHDNVIFRYYNRALREAGLRRVSFHSLRHSNASFRIRSGQNIKYIQTQLGHASIQITLDVYGHLFNDADFNRQQVQLLEGFGRKTVENHSQEDVTEEDNSVVLLANRRAV